MSTQATVTMTTNGSFQNQPPPDVETASAAGWCSRKRGISALLDLTNTSDQPLSRRSALRARKSIQSQSQSSAPRGDPVQGGKLRQSCTVLHEPSSLLQNMDGDNIGDKLAGYVQRNVSFEIQKALAINIVAIAISKWQCGIMEATKRAGDCCGFNAETVRRWISTFVRNMNMCSLNEMNDDCITGMLSSSRGMHDKHSASLLHDEDFCFAAPAVSCM